DAALPAQDLLDVGGVRHHEAHELGAPHGLGDRAAGGAPRLHQRLRLLRGAVEPADVVPGLLHVDGHRATHGAQADEPDGGHGISLELSPRGSTTLSPGPPCRVGPDVTGVAGVPYEVGSAVTSVTRHP